MKIVSYILLSVSTFFFWASQSLKLTQRKVPVDDLFPGTHLTCGIYIEKTFINGKPVFLCANPSIGFFYKDTIYEEEVVGRLAENEDFHAVFEYLADKIDECEALAGKLNALQRGVQEQQAV